MTLAPAPSIPATGVLYVTPWPDPIIDSLGLDPRSAYVETYWLGTLGPSTTWLLRRLAHGLESAPAGFELDLPTCARELGLGDKGGRHSPFARSLSRLVQFEIARWQPMHGTLEVRRRVPPLNRRQVMHLPDGLRTRHDHWQARQLDAPPAEVVRRRCRQLALALIQTGEERENAERQLLRWGYHPALCYESTAWAAEQSAAAGVSTVA
ncbi:MAG: hypothetical protein QOJ00_1439 [Actinomycetota bacterium]